MVECDVLVIGAGPTGLMMAAELIRYGLEVVIVDMRAEPTDKSKALAVQPRSLEILASIGLGDEFLSRGLKLSGMDLHSHGNELGRVQMSHVESDFPFILSLPQSESERILSDHLSRLGGEVERECEVTELRTEGEHWIARVRGLKQEEVKAKYVIGCDGAHSFIRHHFDLSFSGVAFEEVFSLADVKIQWKYPHDRVSTFLETSGPFIAIPLPHDGIYRLIFQLPRCQRPAKVTDDHEDNLNVEQPPPTIEEVISLVKGVADGDAKISDPLWLANFHVNSRLTSQYRLGRVFLCGDAAHIHSPIGGQGMNTGLQDAFNLAWKIGMVHHGIAGEQLLDSYQEERHGVAKRLLSGTERGTRIINFKQKWKIKLRNFIASYLLGVGDVQRELANTVTQIRVHYDKSRIIENEGRFEGGPKAGYRMPNGPCRALEKVYHSTELTLFVFSDDATVHEQIMALKLPMQVHQIEDRASWDFFGCKNGGAYLVRPDHYIAYRQTPLNINQLADHMKKYSV